MLLNFPKTFSISLSWRLFPLSWQQFRSVVVQINLDGYTRMYAFPIKISISLRFSSRLSYCCDNRALIFYRLNPMSPKDKRSPKKGHLLTMCQLYNWAFMFIPTRSINHQMTIFRRKICWRKCRNGVMNFEEEEKPPQIWPIQDVFV